MIMPVNKTGWIPYTLRNNYQKRMTDQYHERIGTFSQRGQRLSDVPERVIMHELEIKATGGLLPRIWQQTGSCLPPGSLVRMADGFEKPISDIKAGDWVVSHTGQQRKVMGVQCKRTIEHMRTISVQGYAGTLRCTDNHVVPTWDGNSIVWKKACEIATGDFMLVGLGVSKSVAMYHELDSLDFVHGVDLDELSLSCIGNEAAETHRRPKALLNEAQSRGLIGSGRVHCYKSRLSNTIPRNVRLDEGLGRLIGLYLAEGSCDAHRVTWTLSTDKADLVDDVVELIKDVFGVEATVQSNAHSKAVSVRLNGLAYVQFFKGICPGTAFNKRVPALIFSSPLSVQESVVSGWLDGDGYCQERKKGVRIVGVSANLNLIRDFGCLFYSLGVPFSARARSPHKQTGNIAYDISPYPAIAAERLTSSKRLRKLACFKGHASTKKMTPFGMARAVLSNVEGDVPEYDVWDIEVEHDHTFIADGFVVHNCVGCGGARAYTLAQVGDVVCRGDQEAIKIPFPFATYGVGREISGARGKGEGSFGGAQAKAIRDFGMLSWDFENSKIPRPTIKNGWATWKSSEEMTWSHPSAWPIRRSELEIESKKYAIQDVTQVETVDDLVQGIAQGYSGTIACMFGTRKCIVQGDVLIAPWNDEWAHQQCIAGYWKHPRLGLIFIIDNQWNDVHGECPTLGPIGVNGSYWMLEKDMAKILRSRDGEVYLHSNTKGFPLQLIDWGTMGIVV